MAIREVKCRQCGNLFIGTSRAVFCSNKCKQKNFRDDGSTGFIYAIHVDGNTKVGTSREPKKRVSRLSKTFGVDNPKYFISEKCISPYKVEKAIHKKLNKKAEFGEFFTDDYDFIVEVIKSEAIEISNSDAKRLGECEEVRKKESEKNTDEIIDGFKNAQEQYFRDKIKENMNKVIMKDTLELCSICEDATLIDKLMNCDSDTEVLIVRCNALEDLMNQYRGLLDDSNKLNDMLKSAVDLK